MMNLMARFIHVINAIPDHATRARCLYADIPPFVIVCQGHLRPVCPAVVGSQTQIQRLKRDSVHRKADRIILRLTS